MFTYSFIILFQASVITSSINPGRRPELFHGIFKHRSPNTFRRNHLHSALIPFDWENSEDRKKDKQTDDYKSWNWTSDKAGGVFKTESAPSSTCTASTVRSPPQKVDTIQKILEGVTPNLFILKDTYGGSNSVIVRIGKNQANKLGIVDGNYVRIKGRRRRFTLGVVKIDATIEDNHVFIHADVRRNLRLRLGDVVAIDPLDKLPDAKIVRILPFGDTTKPLSKHIPDENIKGALNKLLLDYFTKEIANRKKRPIKLGDHLSLLVRPEGKNSLTLDSDTEKSFKLEFKIVDVKSLKNGYKGITNVDLGLISGDSIIDTNGTLLTREHDDDSYGEVGYDDIGGMGRQLNKIRELIELPLLHPELFKTVGIAPPKGVILHGPPGSGKTLIARAIAAETGATCHIINGPEIMSKHVGESEAKLRRAFEKASNNGPAIIFIDEIDSIAPKREKSGGELERRIVSQLLTLMDGITPNNNVVVLAATNRINSIDSALRRFGRFDREIEMASCDENERLEILKVKTKGMRLASDVSLSKIASECHGYVGADIAQLCFEAAMCCIREHVASVDLLQFGDSIPQDILDNLVIKNKHFSEALGLCNPSTLRERRVEIPETTWDDIGGLEQVKKELIETIQYPVEHPDKFRKFGQSSSKGVLFYGPPGCGKTLLAKAIAHECNANFISIKGPELLTMWFGESEANVRELFDKARASAPCILFFDEIDSIAKTRGSGGTGTGSEAADRVINQILTEIDGINVQKPIFIIAATNRPDIIDPAIMRPGRLGKLVYIPLPDLKSRESIFKATLKNSPLSPDVNIKKMAETMEGYSGADIAEVCHRAAREAIRESIEAEIKRGRPLGKDEQDPVPYITNSHFQVALKNSRKSVNQADVKLYESFKDKIASKM
ncbi:cell division cycle protein 48, putative [Theileria equi strain WA]|uniref:Cell division cycle protein 48, putative n=1 Tax=Theileria equi strain WA TaxID=1537102 RepID=L1LBM1_THEEQ|nr:cell division cycle protein 48, putative [Theileria equi strain WA]EKX72669.1 cell division cycle protein 48, putative [Theileria equi strain WA]|eukprot:XP_004832121.1 cell division cycle protein 48, putative [Theileria equi strain WA]